MACSFDIAFGIHNRNNYYIHALVALHSILSRSSTPLATHILHDDSLREMEKAIFVQVANAYNCRIFFHDVSPFLSRIPKIRAFEKFSIGCMCRLFIPEILKDMKVLYLDGDIVANADITGIIRPLLEAGHMHPLWAVPDAFALHPAAKGRLEKLCLDPSRYFNSGVLLFDNGSIQAKFGNFTEIAHKVALKLGSLEYPDQDILNVIFSAKDIGWLPKKANYQIQYKNRYMLTPESLKGFVAHYASLKPWDEYFAAAALYWQEREKLAQIIS